MQNKPESSRQCQGLPSLTASIQGWDLGLIGCGTRAKCSSWFYSGSSVQRR